MGAMARPLRRRWATNGRTDDFSLKEIGGPHPPLLHRKNRVAAGHAARSTCSAVVLPERLPGVSFPVRQWPNRLVNYGDVRSERA